MASWFKYFNTSKMLDGPEYTDSIRPSRFSNRKVNGFFRGTHLKIEHSLTSYDVQVTIHATKNGESLQEETFSTHVWTLSVGHWFISKFAEHVLATYYLNNIQNELPLKWKFSSFPTKTEMVGGLGENIKSYRDEYSKHLGYEYVSTLMLKASESTVIPKADSRELLFLLTIDGQDKAYFITSGSIGRDGDTTIDTIDSVPLYLPIPSTSSVHIKLNVDKKVHTFELEINSAKKIDLHHIIK